MSAVPLEFVQVVAETLGQAALPAEAAAALAPEVELELRTVVEGARKFARACKRKRLTAADVNDSLRLSNSEPLYGFAGRSGAAGAEARFQPLGAGEPGVFVLDDPVVSLADLVQQPLPPCPVQPFFTLHWLAVEGEQPAVPQNPGAESSAAAAASSSSSSAAAAAAAGKGGGGDGGLAALSASLSTEQRMLLEAITGAVTSGDEEREHSALLEASTDPALQALLPYLAKYCYDRVMHNLRDLPLLRSLMRLLRALLRNPHLNCESVLEKLLPTMLTCIVGRHLCRSPAEDHWALRDLCAEAVAEVCRRYGPEYSDLQPRISRTLHEALTKPKKPLTTQYGAIVGISRLGPLATQQLLVPHLEAYLAKLQQVAAKKSAVSNLEASMCEGAVLRAVGALLRDDSVAGVDREGLHALFGERLIPFLRNADTVETSL